MTSHAMVKIGKKLYHNFGRGIDMTSLSCRSKSSSLYHIFGRGIDMTDTQGKAIKRKLYHIFGRGIDMTLFCFLHFTN